MPKPQVCVGGDKTLLVCEDGSHTLYSKVFEEPYHSTKDGALHESLEKHVKPALHLKADKASLTILDICFGLGYNTLSTLYYIKTHGLSTKVHILSPEFDRDLVRSLARFTYPSEFAILQPIIQTLAAQGFYEDAQCKIEILFGDAREEITKIKEKVDIIYQDAFSPVQNPLLWTHEWFRDIRAISYEDAILTTYSTAAAVRLGLYENGFYVFVHRAPKARFSTIASLKMIAGFESIDMELKKVRNPLAQSLRDRDFKA